MDWSKRRKKIKKIEIAVIIVAVIIIIFGMISDLLVLKGIIFLLVKDLPEFSLTLLQIQASLTTLTLAIIALLSGAISDSYMGVSVSQFFLDRKPYYLKQKSIIVIEFILLALSVWGHLFGLYNLVISFFMISLLLIIVAILEIYGVFKGKNAICEEIEAYVFSSMMHKKNYFKIGEDFIADWKTIASSQSLEQFKHYRELFIKYIIRILSKEKNIDDINSLSESIARFFLQHELIGCRLKGIQFVDYFYEQINIWFSQDTNLHFEKPISLISRLAGEWCDALDSIAAEQIEDIIGIDTFFKNIIQVAAFRIGADNERSDDVWALNGIAKYLGDYISKQNRKGNLIDDKYWERICFNRFDFIRCFLENKEFYNQSLVKIRFNVCYGYIMSNQVNMVKESVFLDGASNVYNIQDKETAMIIMLVHCYMFYLAFRETPECIEDEMKKTIKEALLDQKIVQIVSRFYYRLAFREGVLDDNIGDEIEEIIRHYEKFPKHGGGKVVVLEGAVRDYLLYIALLMDGYSHHQYGLNLLNAQKYYDYLIEARYSTFIKCITEIHPLFVKQCDLEKGNSIRNDEMHSAFAGYMSEKYKSYIIDNASDSQRNYEINNVQEEVEKQLKDEILKGFNDAFNGFDADCTDIRHYKKIKICEINYFTKFMQESQSMSFADYAIGNFTVWLIKELASAFNIKIINRDEKFEDDKSFISFIEKYSILLGSQYVFDCIDLEYYKEYKDFFNQKECRFVIEHENGIALFDKDIYISLDDIFVDIYSPELCDIGARKNEETGKYSYETIEGISLDFEKKELRELVHDEKKIIEIYISVSIGLNKKEIEPMIIMRALDR